MKTELVIVTATVTPVEVSSINCNVWYSSTKELKEVTFDLLVPSRPKSNTQIKVGAFVIPETKKLLGYSKLSGDIVEAQGPYVVCHLTCDYSENPTVCYKYNNKYYFDMFETKDGYKYLRHELSLSAIDELEALF